VLLFRAADAREVLPQELRARGIDVEVVAAYRTRRLGADQSERLISMFGERRIDAVLVTSSSMATSLVEALGPDAAALLDQVVVASIGPITTQTLEQLGVRVDVTSTTHTIPALLDTLESHWR
jgi:uroporphyrinogen III methyltransferase/synthase